MDTTQDNRNGAQPEVPLAARQAAGLRALADMIEQNPEVADMAAYYISHLSMFCSTSPEHHALLAKAALRHGATVDKWVTADLYNLKLSFAGGAVVAEVLAGRDAVCERVVTGIETVTKSVPDPAALAEAPVIEVTEEVETVEWVCRPLLAATDGAVA